MLSLVYLIQIYLSKVIWFYYSVLPNVVVQLLFALGITHN